MTEQERLDLAMRLKTLEPSDIAERIAYLEGRIEVLARIAFRDYTQENVWASKVLAEAFAAKKLWDRDRRRGNVPPEQVRPDKGPEERR